jgi:hypothetical protein
VEEPGGAWRPGQDGGQAAQRAWSRGAAVTTEDGERGRMCGILEDEPIICEGAREVGRSYREEEERESSSALILGGWQSQIERPSLFSLRWIA